MSLICAKSEPGWRVALMAVAAGFALMQGCVAGETRIIPVQAAGFDLGREKSVFDGTNRWELALEQPVGRVPFNQLAVKQGTQPAMLGPDPKIPYFMVRFALPIPPENATNEVATLAGLDPEVFTHNHSPGLEILPNGDVLAVYFSTPPGQSESDVTTSFIQARLRYGAEEWDLPELFFKTKGYNDQSGLLWKDGQKIWFFGGGRELSDRVPFKLATSCDNGATWTLTLPQLDRPAEHFTAQPITSAFRSPDQSIYFAMDGDKATSFLWRSRDEGVHWQDMGGRTGGRHSAIVPLNERGYLLSIGGKNASVSGWSPENFSTNWGLSWSPSEASPFPPLGTAQRPSLIRLADGNLFFTSDAWLHKAGKAPPPDWKYGNGGFVAISTNQGVTWLVKVLPVQLPNHERERGTNGTLGYVTARQAPNGLIHILTTETQPCLHYELNEAWVFSPAGERRPDSTVQEVKHYVENYPNGKLRAQWSAAICASGRYLLHGRETDYYENGAKQHEVIYASGRKTGVENFWSPTGKKLWSWTRNLESNTGVWTQYWPNGRKKMESAWNIRPTARDLARSFYGLVAHGPVRQWNERGELIRSARFVNGGFREKEGL